MRCARLEKTEWRSVSYFCRRGNSKRRKRSRRAQCDAVVYLGGRDFLELGFSRRCGFSMCRNVREMGARYNSRFGVEEVLSIMEERGGISKCLMCFQIFGSIISEVFWHTLQRSMSLFMNLGD